MGKAKSNPAADRARELARLARLQVGTGNGTKQEVPEQDAADALARERAQAVVEIRGRLSPAALEAVDVLRAIAKDTTQPGLTRVKAATKILGATVMFGAAPPAMTKSVFDNVFGPIGARG